MTSQRHIIDAIRADHEQLAGLCCQCEHDWPCPAERGAAEIERLQCVEAAIMNDYRACMEERDTARAALKDTRHFFLGHFDDNCEECRRGKAVIDAALA